ncbi:DUF2892 domain-containing protein [Aneurinibacillus sp. Ricciae_BoGa-3]|uniref:YgaP family membrane protein n=1 Tax=Aneurinibacillus sp. Ricciae_BoGa-3 TaxID=3022697 RepID=UPI00233FF553|nr:DUF2892 domain-containing protein [Aneurinibacillus sp. Ricciae_BoGa-3]WCK55027.1 DUF2892 domain-containing protein [Aneurinibacillus sp. Ricciae_BoGa-3]
MRKNVGTIDAMIRIVIGLAGLAWVTARIVRKPQNISPIMWAVLFAMKVAEGIVRYCPMLAVLQIDTRIDSYNPGKKPYRIARYARNRS